MGRLELLKKCPHATDFDWEQDFPFPTDETQLVSNDLPVRPHKTVNVDDGKSPVDLFL